MTQPLFECPPPAALQLLREQFSAESLSRICGQLLPPHTAWDAPLLGPLSEFLSRPAKEFRASLVELSYGLAGGQGQPPELLPALVEVLHAGSLIVDDIEDGSSSRRGGAAFHLKYGMPLAMNAGNWLYFLAFDTVQRMGVGPHIELALYRWMSRAVFACHYGQGLDLTAVMANIPREHVVSVVSATTQLKTGSLMEFAAASGAIVAGGKKSTVNALTSFAGELGQALQMLDDLGGLFDESRCHKGHEDLINGRPTWPWAWLAESASEERFLHLQALSRAVERRDMHPEVLAGEMRSGLGTHVRQSLSVRLKQAFSRLTAEIGSHPMLGRLNQEVQRIEQSYG